MHGSVSTEGSETKVELEKSKRLAGRPIALESALRWRALTMTVRLLMPSPFVFSRIPYESWNAESKSFQIALEWLEGKWTEGI